ncbi:hypothetical protein E4U42_000608 [Claviceps africana]|uniref:BZIP domain-containing protein n=1 Tax=Claviceps africana TaxID=83212 RepID=A0A8K0J1I6_9HYPO|nr:hypothetical protein E4U42_000608 [Claviceps africana]
MESMFTSQLGDSHFADEALEDYSAWPVHPWFDPSQPCSPAFTHRLKNESAPCLTQDAMTPWMYMSNPETRLFTSPTTEQPPTLPCNPAPDGTEQSLLPPKHRQSAKKKTKPVVEDETVDRPIPRRARTRRSKSLSSSGKSSPEDSSARDKDDMYQERSRMASNKFRARKRSEIAQLESEEYSIEEANRSLRGVLDSLTGEILSLKMQILQHTHCNCELIQEYISKEALSFVQDMETVSS